MPFFTTAAAAADKIVLLASMLVTLEQIITIIIWMKTSSFFFSLLARYMDKFYLKHLPYPIGRHNYLAVGKGAKWVLVYRTVYSFTRQV